MVRLAKTALMSIFEISLTAEGPLSLSREQPTAVPTIRSINAWDGKDGQLFVEEEYDLSDVDLGDLGKDGL